MLVHNYANKGATGYMGVSRQNPSHMESNTSLNRGNDSKMLFKYDREYLYEQAISLKSNMNTVREENK